MAVTRISRADRKQQTRESLMDSAYRLFTSQGFHRTSLDQVSAEAGFTKGAVYSNFASKEDLFFAVYERRVEASVQHLETLVDEFGAAAPMESARHVLAGRRSNDGWMAVFFEFWAHVLRHPELRARFLELHSRARRPLVRATQEWRPDLDAERWTTTMFALVTGANLEQLTDPAFDGAAAVEDVIERLED